MTLEQIIKLIEDKAQKDWTFRSEDMHNADTVQGIQIGYDRVLRMLKDECK